MKPKRRPRKGGGNASRRTPTKVDRNPASRGPSQPRLFKATAASAHHLVSPNPSLKHKTPTTHLLSFVNPPPGITFGVAATTTRHAEYRGGLKGDYSSIPQNLPAAGEPAADPDYAWRDRRAPLPHGSGRRWQQVVADRASDLRPCPARRPRTPRGLEAGAAPPRPRKKSWQH